MNTPLTRNGRTPVFPVYYRSKRAGEYAVQEVARMDVRPEARHYGPRFETVKVARQAVAERVMLHMRTDGRKVRLAVR